MLLSGTASHDYILAVHTLRVEALIMVVGRNPSIFRAQVVGFTRSGDLSRHLNCRPERVGPVIEGLCLRRYHNVWCEDTWVRSIGRVLDGVSGIALKLDRVRGVQLFFVDILRRFIARSQLKHASRIPKPMAGLVLFIWSNQLRGLWDGRHGGLRGRCKLTCNARIVAIGGTVGRMLALLEREVRYARQRGRHGCFIGCVDAHVVVS